MKTRLVNMGNSRGVRLPKPIIKQLELEDEVELTLKPEGLLITPVRSARAGWAEAAASAQEPPLLPELPNRFDEEEWTW
jgi:antitoxin MazE